LDKARNFRVLQLFLVSSLEPIWDNEGERKKGSFFFILLGKSVIKNSSFSLVVNYLIIIAKELGDPFLLLRGGNSLFHKMLEALMICFNLEALAQEIRMPEIHSMQNRQNFLFIDRLSQMALRNFFVGEGD
jgi:hypothetical protein